MREIRSDLGPRPSALGPRRSALGGIGVTALAPVLCRPQAACECPEPDRGLFRYNAGIGPYQG
jgi:hypothetical protein